MGIENLFEIVFLLVLKFLCYDCLFAFVSVQAMTVLFAFVSV